jgi:hypothetical protein
VKAKVIYSNLWYKYFLWGSLIYIVSLSSLDLTLRIRIFSIAYIVLCILIIAFSKHSYKYFRLLIKLWAVLLVFSGGMILISTIIYVLSGAAHKISADGNVLAVINLFMGIVLYKYFERSVQPL